LTKSNDTVMLSRATTVPLGTNNLHLSTTTATNAGRVGIGTTAPSASSAIQEINSENNRIINQKRAFICFHFQLSTKQKRAVAVA
ncbi:MAG: hypothetical protein LBQ73_11165, partial [Tannerellaceae bacterium]|nr:hypothetical protein [Tannerellaceae bacterium]